MCFVRPMCCNIKEDHIAVSKSYETGSALTDLCNEWQHGYERLCSFGKAGGFHSIILSQMSFAAFSRANVASSHSLRPLFLLQQIQASVRGDRTMPGLVAPFAAASLEHFYVDIFDFTGIAMW
ncbi:hypothetical protein GN244_ATG16896 [Phytophthora infestans]|uniref:Uncharacterized protein n=1 Tax=Phytophthora infestans TaxID=4787 RepID=A0A833W705_PHYIN|nr:hypothetical protein GN244_ATG16896 [Phytophthora infestans]KAF4128139.1 hypothetical protein GN958_ATG22685 [Phytophthora infestans]